MNCLGVIGNKIKAYLVNVAGAIINPSTEEKQDAGNAILATIDADTGSILTTQTDGTQKTKVVGSDGTVMTVNTEGRGDVIQHAHISQGTQHFHIDGLTTGTYRYILIDISDTTNYPHTLDTYVHIEWMELEVDSDNQGAYKVNLGFLDDVDSENGDRYIVKHWSGSRTAGNQILEFLSPYPNGWRMRPENVVTHMVSTDDTNYQTDVDMPSTLSPAAADTPSGTGDVVLEVTVTAGTIDIAIEIGYHTH